MRLPSVADSARFVKDNRIISRGLGLLPYYPAQIAGQIAGQLGLGKRRRVRIASKASPLRMAKGPKVGAVKVTRARKEANVVLSGMPVPVRVSRRRVQHGGSFGSIMGDIGGGIGGFLGNGIGGLGRGIFGRGKGKRKTKRSLV